MNLQYHVILTKRDPLNSEGLSLLNNAFNLWHEQWRFLYRQQGSEFQPAAEDFLKYDYVVVLTSGENVVGMSAHTFYDLRLNAALKTEFIGLFGEEFVGELKKRNMSVVASYESLLVNPDFRNNTWKLPIGRLLIFLGNYLFSTTSAQAFIATGRKDVKVSEISKSCGYEVIIADKICRNFPCDLIAQVNKRFDDVNDPLYFSAQRLWAERTIHGDRSELGRMKTLRAA